VGIAFGIDQYCCYCAMQHDLPELLNEICVEQTETEPSESSKDAVAECHDS